MNAVADNSGTSCRDSLFTLLSNCGGIIDVEFGVRWDAAALTDEVTRRAAFLAERDIGPGSVVTIAHGGSTRFFADLFAAWSVGATAACLDSTLTRGELQNIVEFADAAALLTDGGTAIDDFPVPVLELHRAAASGASKTLSTIKPDDPALLLFTSGTTGTPKGVVLTFGALLARIQANIATIGRNTLRKALVTLPTYFGHGLIGNSLTPLLAGGEIVLHPRGMPLINNLGAIIDEHEISFMSTVPSLWRLALTCSSAPTGRSLRRVHVGSAPLSGALWSDIVSWSGAEVVNCYGITETANWIAGASSREDGIIEGLVGRVWGGKAAVLDESGSIRDCGAGEIIIKSACLMSGYLKRPDLTAAAFREGWFRTGDQGSVDEEGRIWVTGRIKDEINRGGFKVQPAEIDSLLERHPAVAEACVFGIPDPMGGEAVAAAIRLAEGHSATPLSLQSWCSERVRRAAVPEHWFFVNEIPRTGRGKVSRDGVRRALTQNTENAHTLPSEPKRQAAAGLTIASTFVLDPLLPFMRFALQEAGLALEVCAVPYSQPIQELLSPASLLVANSNGLNVVLLRLEDFVRDAKEIGEARRVIQQTALELCDALKGLAQGAKVPTLLASFPPSPRVPKELLAEIEAANTTLTAEVRSLPRLTLLQQEDLSLTSSQDHYDMVGDRFAHMPYTEPYYAAIARAIACWAHGVRVAGGMLPQSLASAEGLLQAWRAQSTVSRTLPGNPTMPATDAERELLALWEKVLGIGGLGVEDDFFAAGGTSLMAARLFAEIAQRHGLKLPLSTILEAPTVRALSRNFVEKQTPPAGSLIALKHGGPRNLFLVHDGVGETLLYLNLARRMPSDLAVYGIEPRRFPGVPIMHTRVEDMASFYIEEIRKKQPRGPYLLSGMCAGGVIAYEMAFQLMRAGESVELVALLDAVTPRTPKRVKPGHANRKGSSKGIFNELRQAGLTPAQHARVIAQTGARKLAHSIAWRYWHYRAACVAWSVRARFGLLRTLPVINARWSRFVPALTFQQILSCAVARYVPKTLSNCLVVLARATSGEAADMPYASIYADETMGWAAVAEKLTILDVDGGHESMLKEPFVASLAEALRPYVQEKSVQFHAPTVEVG